MGVGLELDAQAAESLEGMFQHQELGLDVGACLPVCWCEPGPPDLQPPVLGTKGEITGAANKLSCGCIHGSESGLLPCRRSSQGVLEPGVKPLAGPTGVVVHPAPDPLIPRSLEEPLLVAARQRLQTHDLPFQHTPQVLPHAPYPHSGPVRRYGSVKRVEGGSALLRPALVSKSAVSFLCAGRLMA